jgi:glycosyltransferase involved in cell wall biosynthesis
MKVLFTFGGLPHYYNAILNKLNSIEGLEVHVAVPRMDHNTIGKGVFQTNEGINFKLHYLDEYNTYYGKSFFKDFIKLIYKEKPDIVITIWPYILGFVFKPYILITLKLLRIKLILKEIPFQVPKYNDARAYYRSGMLLDENLEDQLKGTSKIGMLKYDFLSFIRKIYYKLVDANVEYIEDAYDIIGSYGVRKNKIFIIYNSPDTDELLKIKNDIKSLPPIMPENNFRLIHVGRLVKWKKVDLLINAFSIVIDKFPCAELIIIGTGPEEKALKELAVKKNVAGSVKFIGGIYDSKVLGQYLSASSVYVLAGMGGLSINEAMCFDKPVICSVCDGTEKKLVRDDFNGKYFEDGNVNDLKDKIDYLFSNQELMTKMGKNSGKIISEEINLNTVIRGYLNAFDYVMKTNVRFK